jgi:hypothetical protein
MACCRPKVERRGTPLTSAGAFGLSKNGTVRGYIVRLRRSPPDSHAEFFLCGGGRLGFSFSLSKRTILSVCAKRREDRGNLCQRGNHRSNLDGQSRTMNFCCTIAARRYRLAAASTKNAAAALVRAADRPRCEFLSPCVSSGQRSCCTHAAPSASVRPTASDDRRIITDCIMMAARPWRSIVRRR